MKKRCICLVGLILAALCIVCPVQAEQLIPAEIRFGYQRFVKVEG